MDGPITIVSTTETAEQIRAAMGLKPEKSEPVTTTQETTPAPADKTPPEKPAASASAPAEPPVEKPDEKQKPDEKASTEERFQRRIDQLTGKLRASEREGTATQTELQRQRDVIADLQRTLATLTKPPDAKVEPPKEEAKPKQEDFETHDAWVEALTDWKVRQELAKRPEPKIDELVEAKLKEERDRRAVEARQHAEAAAARAYQERRHETVAKHPDFDAAMDAADEARINVPPYVEAVFVHAPEGAELMYALAAEVKAALEAGTPVEETALAQIVKLDPEDAFTELGYFAGKAGLGRTLSREQIRGLPPAVRLYELGRLSAGGPSAASNGDAVPAGSTSEPPPAAAAAHTDRPPPRAVTPRPKPPTTVLGAGTSAPKLDLATVEDYPTYRRIRNEQEAKRRLANR